jgi:hypothetical protein
MRATVAGAPVAGGAFAGRGACGGWLAAGGEQRARRRAVRLPPAPARARRPPDGLAARVNVPVCPRGGCHLAAGAGAWARQLFRLFPFCV